MRYEKCALLKKTAVIFSPTENEVGLWSTKPFLEEVDEKFKIYKTTEN